MNCIAGHHFCTGPSPRTDGEGMLAKKRRKGSEKQLDFIFCMEKQAFIFFADFLGKYAMAQE